MHDGLGFPLCTLPRGDRRWWWGLVRADASPSRAPTTLHRAHARAPRGTDRLEGTHPVEAVDQSNGSLVAGIMIGALCSARLRP